MLPTSDRAFKEWAVICRALAEGRQVVILRKGGIQECERGFEVTDREFFLFPTFSHQSPESVVSEWRRTLLSLEEPETGTVRVSHFAVVDRWLRIEDLESLRNLRGLHVWSEEVVEERFHRWAEEGLFALIVRVYELPKPVVLELREEYTGCKSWVTLEERISLSGARPVLSEEEFVRRVADFKSATITNS